MTWLYLFLACRGGDPVEKDPATTSSPTSDDDDDDDIVPTGDDDDDDDQDSASGDTGEPFDVGDGRIVGWSDVSTNTTTGWMVVDPLIYPLDAATLGGLPLTLNVAGTAAYTFDVPSELGSGTHVLEVRGVLGGPSRQLVELVDPMFVDVADEVGLADVHDITGWQRGCAQSLTGVAFADFDLDGDMDAVIGHIGATTRFLENTAPAGALASFEDSAGITFPDLDHVSSLAVADLDGDRDPDLWVGRRGENRIYANRFVESGALSFEDVTESWSYPVSDQRTMGAVFGDPDNDGDLDIYEINHTHCFPGPKGTADISDRYYERDSDGYRDQTSIFPDSSLSFGPPVSGRAGFSGLFIDVDRDRDLDLLVANDFVANTGPNVAFVNTNLGWNDASMLSGFALHPDPFFKGLNGMGISVADINGDGLPDISESNIGPNVLFISSVGLTGGTVWTQEGGQRGIQRGQLPWGNTATTWGTHLFDYDNDGDVDLFYVGGPVTGDGPMPHALFENQGDGTFREVTWAAGLANLEHGKSTALVDLDHDGFLDLVVANWDAPLEVYRNAMADRVSNHWVMVDLVGDGDLVHPDAFGAIAELDYLVGGVVKTQTCFHTPRPSLGGASETACHFGLGSSTDVLEVRVDWPDGSTTTHPIDVVDQRVTITYP